METRLHSSLEEDPLASARFPLTLRIRVTWFATKADIG